MKRAYVTWKNKVHVDVTTINVMHMFYYFITYFKFFIMPNTRNLFSQYSFIWGVYSNVRFALVFICSDAPRDDFGNWCITTRVRINFEGISK